MIDGTLRQNLKKSSALLLATLICVSAMAGCSGSKKQNQGAAKAPAQQTQQVQQNSSTPEVKANTAEKEPAAKEDAGKNKNLVISSSSKPTPQQNNEKGSEKNKKTASNKADGSKQTNSPVKSGGKK